MNFDALKEIWSSQVPGRVDLTERDELFSRIKKDSRDFDAMIVSRDRQELRTGFYLIAVFVGTGVFYGRPAGVVWPFVAAAVCMFWICAFFVVEKQIARRRRPSNAEPLSEALEAALAHVERQIWMLRSVGWWYLFPAQSGWFLFFLGILLGPNFPRWLLLVVLPFLLWWLWRGTVEVYRLNQDAVAKDLRPRSEELKKLRDALLSSETDDGSGSEKNL